MDLDEPADVHWIADFTPNVVHGGEKRSCETVAEAVRFVMETLREPSRSTAWIAAPEKHLDYARKSRRSTRAPNTGISRADFGRDRRPSALRRGPC
jgi:hypothetical protein